MHVPAARRDRPILAGVGLLGLLVAIALTVTSATDLAIALTVSAATLAVASASDWSPTELRGAAATLALAALIAWLAAAGVTLVEAYSVPVAMAVLVSGGLLRRQRPGSSSWIAYGPGLLILLGPSLAMAIDHGPLLRVVFVTATALITVALGAHSQQQAPIILGAGALLILAVDFGAPLARDIPRWIPIGVAGAALLWLGATFERRMNNLRRLQAVFRELG
jgi:hypothetical protein